MLEGFTRSFDPLEILSEGELEAIHRGGLYTLENTGMLAQLKAKWLSDGSWVAELP